MAFAGLRGTGDWGQDERPKSFREAILWANPNGSAPLFALMGKAKSQKVTDPEHSWWDEKLTGIRVKVNNAAGYIATDNTLTITADGLRLVPGDVLQVEKTEDVGYTNEFVEVSSVTSDTVIVVKRGVAGTAGAALAQGTFMTKLGSSFEEGSGGPEKTTRNPIKLFNYAEIFKTAVGLTNTAEVTDTRTGDPWKNDKKRRSFDHSVDIEMAMLYGRPYETTGPKGKPKRYMGGLRYFLNTNVTIFSSTPTEDTFLDAVYRVFDFNKDSGAGDERLVLAGNGFLNNLNKLARNSPSTRINFDKKITLYGMNLQQWVLPQGVLGIKTHPLMNLHSRYTNSAFIIDPTNLVYRPLRDTKFKDNTQANDVDAHEAQWLTECTFEVHHEYTMGYISNFVLP
ncbi:MAG TPA: DUF5309 family protein [Nitrospiraceae bacterium]